MYSIYYYYLYILLKLRQVCPQNADKVVRVENTEGRKLAGVRPAFRRLYGLQIMDEKK